MNNLPSGSDHDANAPYNEKFEYFLETHFGVCEICDESNELNNKEMCENCHYDNEESK